MVCLLVYSVRMECLLGYISPCDHDKSRMPSGHFVAWLVVALLALGHCGAEDVGRIHLGVHSSFHRLCK